MIPPSVRPGDPASTRLVLSVPHGGRVLPEEARAALLADPGALWSDWRTDELYDFAADLGLPSVVARASRFVADPNRDPAGPSHGSFWSTVVPAEDPWGRPLYGRPLDADELAARVAAAHRPFHAALDDLVAASLRHHPRVLLLDLHSFGLRLDADVVIGDRHGTTADPAVSDRVEEALAAVGFRVRRNDPFPGGWITARYQHDDRVDAVQIELDQRTHLQADDVDRAVPDPRPDEAGWNRTRRRLAATLEALRDGPEHRVAPQEDEAGRRARAERPDDPVRRP
ncbi:N-formylglutamate amidohydrolase [Amnibacterium kyonggiense]